MHGCTPPFPLLGKVFIVKIQPCTAANNEKQKACCAGWDRSILGWGDFPLVIQRTDICSSCGHCCFKITDSPLIPKHIAQYLK